MEQKKTMESQSTFQQFEEDDWRGNEANRPKGPQPDQPPPDYPVADWLNPKLDHNDVWMYQGLIEACLRRNLPDTMNERPIALLRVLGARARMAYDLEEKYER